MPHWIYIPTPASSGWLPSDLSTLAGWWDASDSATLFNATSGGSLPSDGQKIHRWEDKSGDANHMTQSTDALRPIRQTAELNGLDVAEGSSFSMKTGSQPFGATLTEFTVMVAFKTTATLADDVLFRPASGIQLATASDGRLLFDCAPGGDSRAQFGSGTLSGGTPYIVGGDYKGSSDRCRAWRNGSSGTDAPSNEVPAEISIGSSVTALIGDSDATSAYNAAGQLGEIVFCTSLLSDSEREKLEGYLAHKWGLEGDLPSGHPYKNSAP